MFFDMMPKIVYDAKGAGDFNIVTNLLKRVAIKAKVKDGAIMYDTYDIILVDRDPWTLLGGSVARRDDEAPRGPD